MTFKLFSVFDSKGAFFGQLFQEQTESTAIRQFSDAVADKSPQNMWHKHPEDFSLFLVGEYDNLTGELIPCLPKNLVTASALYAARGNLIGADLTEVPSLKNGVEKELVN